MKTVSKIKNMSFNCNINRAVNRNLTTAEDLGTTSSTSILEEVWIKGGGEKVVERKLGLAQSQFAFLIGWVTRFKELAYCS